MSLKYKLLKVIYSIFLTPIYVRYCSQTLYQSLIGCLRLFLKTNDVIWSKRAKTLCELLIKTQRPDGGFDIGYDFNFGRLHKKSESTSPELVGLLALVEYYKVFGGEDVKRAAHRAAAWVTNNALDLGNGEWAIPYGPYSIEQVMVYNGTSFAAGAIGVYLSVFQDDRLQKIYHGMNKYLYCVLESNINEPGKYWYYSDQSRLDLTEIQRNKVDYYHQMQQVEMHTMAELSLSSPYQRSIIIEATLHIASKQEESGTIPYLNTATPIHMWGFCSCASGLIYASQIDTGLKEQHLERARRVIKWIVENSWSGDYFYPIVEKDGTVIDHNFYVRSDAWVFNTLALAIKEGVIENGYLEICEKSYLKMESVNFSGIENHASNLRIRLVNRMLQNAATIIKRVWPK